MASNNDHERVADELFGTVPPALGLYFHVYDSLLVHKGDYVLPFEDSVSPARIRPVTNDGLLEAAAVLRRDPALTLDQTCEHLAARPGRTSGTHEFRLTTLVSTQAVFMLDSTEPAERWLPGERFVDFVSRRIPETAGISAAAKSAVENQRSMKAWKLRARFRLLFKGTTNLAHHLLLDPLHPDGPTLYIFHYTAFLRAQLGRLHQHKVQKDPDTLACLKLGCLPPRLIIETLHSIQTILFHFSDHRSSRILERLITKQGFDDDCAQIHGYKMSADDGDMMEYRYWGERLAALQAFMRERPPRNGFERWIKWQTSESNAFALALAALLISVVVGFLGLAVAALQTWIAWEAWTAPVSNDDDTLATLREIVDLLRDQARR
ncbi:hypothetical protein C8A05DRAFT_39667 [Staphylotrichum tortipilum]|uniref:Uncharacterized protein n=1 Tax=Staphylotrichum tortipilum TaxID=2831512 RepID=A0AAN6M8R3_9PEZI|nr:hypothetical protein C8A05DRAFT_39667 [Staphylotrichum longicolle]